ncbi:MAG: sugar nucleotide-binding protein, partial [Tangfeifania sp.]
MIILVTGAYGQLGSELKVLAEQSSEHQFLFTDSDTLDISDENQVSRFFEKEKPQFVINCAAYTAVDKAETEMET